MSSPDVRKVQREFKFGSVQGMEDPFWPPLSVELDFDVSPSFMNDWADKIFLAANFLELLEDN